MIKPVDEHRVPSPSQGSRRKQSSSPTPEDGDGAQYLAPALTKGLNILEALTDAEHGLSMAEIAERLGRSISEIFRMVITLQRSGWISADQGDRFHLSSKMFELAHRNRPVRTLVEAALPTMQVIARRTHQSCHVSVLAGGRVLVIAHVDAPGTLSLSVRTGSVVGLLDTASGQVLLAFRQPEERMRLVEDYALLSGEPRISHHAGWTAAIESVAHDGYASSPSQQVRGVTNIGYPVWGRNGPVVAALAMPYMESISPQRGPSLDEAREILGEGAVEISRTLGYQVPAGDAD
jgi:DNA-binding IclR family transcriptional regulator